MNDLNKISVRFFRPRPSTPIFDDLIERGEIQPDFAPARYNQLTYIPNRISSEWSCERFDERLDMSRDSKGRNDQNARDGKARQPVDDEERDSEGSGSSLIEAFAK